MKMKKSSKQKTEQPVEPPYHVGQPVPGVDYDAGMGPEGTIHGIDNKVRWMRYKGRLNLFLAAAQVVRALENRPRIEANNRYFIGNREVDQQEYAQRVKDL